MTLQPSSFSKKYKECGHEITSGLVAYPCVKCVQEGKIKFPKYSEVAQW